MELSAKNSLCHQIIDKFHRQWSNVFQKQNKSQCCYFCCQNNDKCMIYDKSTSTRKTGNKSA
jgi:hypothetical protein